MRFGVSTVAAVFAGSLLVFSTAAAAQEARSTRQREALRPADANRTVQADLLSIFEPVKEIKPGMFIQLHSVGLTTKAFGTDFDGLCRRDEVTLWYAPTRDDIRPANAPVQPYSVEAQPSFHFTSIPQAEPRLSEDRVDVWRRECERVAQDSKANWFAAADAQLAIDGALALQAALKAVRGGALKAETCKDLFDQKTSCEEAILANGDIAQLDSVQSCLSEPGTVCFEMQFSSSTKLTIKARRQNAGSEFRPSDMISIAIEQFIIVT